MVSATNVYPDRYPAVVCVKWVIVPAINPLELSVHHINQFHSEAASCEEEHGLLPVPVPLSDAACIRRLRHHHPQVLREERELQGVWVNDFGWGS